MEAIVMRWRELPPPIVTRWRGPDDSVEAIALINPGGLAAIVAPPASQGASLTISRIAATTLNALRAVYVNSANKLALADPANPTAAFACGVTIGAASADAIATAQTSGEMTEAGWNWAEGAVFIGAGGILTQVPVTSGTLVQIGVASGPTKLIINPQYLVDLAD